MNQAKDSYTIPIPPGTEFYVAIEVSKKVWRIQTNDGFVMFFVKTGRWQHRGKMYDGGQAQMETWLKEKKLLPLEEKAAADAVTDPE